MSEVVHDNDEEVVENIEDLLVPRTPDEARDLLPNEGRGALAVLDKICNGEYDEPAHWVDIYPPTDAQEEFNVRKEADLRENGAGSTEMGQILGNWVDMDGKVGEYLREKAEVTPEMKEDEIEDTPMTVYPLITGSLRQTERPDDGDVMVHKVYRTSRYDLHFRIKRKEMEIEGETFVGSTGQVYVRKSDGYTKEEEQDD